MLEQNHIVTPLDIVDTYHGIWKIEQTFCIPKSELDVRPVYVSRFHFLTCFIALLII